MINAGKAKNTIIPGVISIPNESAPGSFVPTPAECGGKVHLLRDRGESVDANYFNLLASNAASGMRSQSFNVAGAAFTPSDAHPLPLANFYPGTTCQIYAQAFGVSELAAQFEAGWAYLNKTTPGWEDGRWDPYPWAILGTVAAMRGQLVLARTQQASIEKKFVSSRAVVTINELGFYQRTKSILAGNPAV